MAISRHIIPAHGGARSECHTQSIATTAGGPYDDAFDRATGTLRYAYRGVDPLHRDNRGLRRAMVERVPLAYFHAIVPGSYVAAYPAVVVEDHPRQLRFSMQVDDLYAVETDVFGPLAVAEDDSEPRRAYVTATFRRIALCCHVARSTYPTERDSSAGTSSSDRRRAGSSSLDPCLTPKVSQPCSKV